MRLHVIYRSTGRENAKARPAFYSKFTALCSLLKAVSECDSSVDLVFLNDGPIPDDRQALMETHGRVVDTGDVPLGRVGQLLRYTTAGSQGLARSHLAALRLVDLAEWDDSDLVYFVEDDYLHTPDALTRLLDGARHLDGASYFSLFASIDPSRAVPLHAPQGTWFTADSATSTYAARIGALRDDRLIHVLAFFAGGTADRDSCRAYTGIRPFKWNSIVSNFFGWAPGQQGRPAGRAGRAVLQWALNSLAIKRGFAPHPLAGSSPVLALHLETPVLDTIGHERWSVLADDTVLWAAEHGLAPAAEVLELGQRRRRSL